MAENKAACKAVGVLETHIIRVQLPNRRIQPQGYIQRRPAKIVNLDQLQTLT